MRDGELYASGGRWVAGSNYGVDASTPVAGFYKFKPRSDAVYRAVKIHFGPPLDPVTGEVLDRSWRWMANLDNGELIDFDLAWPVCAKAPITESDWQYYCSRSAWAAENAPQSAYANPKRRYDPLSTNELLPF